MSDQKQERQISQRLFKINQDSFGYKLAKSIYPAAVAVAGKRAVKLRQIKWEHPANFDHGDYSTNLAMQTFGQDAKRLERKTSRYTASGTLDGKSIETPWDLANEIVNAWRVKGMPEWIAKVEVAQPGFINVTLKKEKLLEELKKVLVEKDKFGKLPLLTGKKILLEHTSPNPQTTIMLGHLRNNFLGMAVSNFWEFLGAKVTKDCIANDRGVHLCRAIWGYLVFGRKRGGLKKAELLEFKKVSDTKIKRTIKTLREWPNGLSRSGKEKRGAWEELLSQWSQKRSNWWQPKDLGLKPDHANLVWYVLGSRAYKKSEKVKKQVDEILLAWEKEEKNVRELWRLVLGWSVKGYADTYSRIGSVHDQVWYEHQLYKKGKEWVEKGLQKGVFRKSEGAIISDLAKYGLSDTVVMKSDGTALYHTFDLNLTDRKRKKFPSDLYVWDIGLEQTLYLKQLYAMCEQLGIGKREDCFHLSYALINFKGAGKMATRTGQVVKADEVLDELHSRATKIIKESNQDLRGKLSPKQLDDLAEIVAVGAVKYSLLKYSRETTIQFDIDESLALEGNSGPYLQYTYARTLSVLRKFKAESEEPKTKVFKRAGKVAKWQSEFSDSETLKLCHSVAFEEASLLRTLYQFPEIVEEAAKSMAPNLLCNYLFDLAQKYNYFYNRLPILKAGQEELVRLRLALTVATAQVLKNGLTLLGITTPERM